MTAGLDRLAFVIYGYCIDVLEWLATSGSVYLDIPRLSLLLSGLWGGAFIVWLVERTIQPTKESSLSQLFGNFWHVWIVSVVMFLAVVVSMVWIVYDYQNNSAVTIAWAKQNIVVPGLITISILAALNLIAGWFAVRYWLPKLNYWVNETVTKKGYQESSFSDIRIVSKDAPSSIDYDPRSLWRLQDEHIFIGLDIVRKPVYITLAEWCSQHQQVLGTTGFGKGVAVSNQLSQCLALGQTVVVFDPKNDEWAPSVLTRIAEHYNRPLCFIDLNVDEPQFNPLFGASQKQIFDLFVGSFGLAEGRGDSDYYRSHERRVVRQWIEGLEKGQSLTQLSDALTETDYKNAPKLCNDLTELAMLGCINTNQKGAWYDVIDQGGLIYIIGSIRSEPVLRLQKMLLLRLMQRLEQRDRNQSHTHVTIFLDELKYLLCKPSLQALGTIRDKFANVILAHQSINDLLDVPDDLDPQAVRSAVLENTALKLIYRSQDPDTVEWIAKRSGTIPAHKEMLEQSRNEGFTEMTGSERRLIETERYLVDPNMILALQKRCGIWFSGDPAKIVFTSPIQTTKRTIVPTLVNTDEEPAQDFSEGKVLDLFS